ncbi:hypothetical protein SAMN05444000_10694 [Shimia gijangensis]|uniref:Uncharacterized protein n=1 Tax=Shimia gijangensis TaxID=1470563 RepID=A0A1M6HMI7_9RHOB|nr:hypothetical protein SAMN05444000_10694 [Shimia gijangensis]
MHGVHKKWGAEAPQFRHSGSLFNTARCFLPAARVSCQGKRARPVTFLLLPEVPPQLCVTFNMPTVRYHSNSRDHIRIRYDHKMLCLIQLIIGIF